MIVSLLKDGVNCAYRWKGTRKVIILLVLKWVIKDDNSFNTPQAIIERVSWHYHYLFKCFSSCICELTNATTHLILLSSKFSRCGTGFLPKGMMERYFPLNLLATVISCLRVHPRSEITWCAAAGGWWLTCDTSRSYEFHSNLNLKYYNLRLSGCLVVGRLPQRFTVSLRQRRTCRKHWNAAAVENPITMAVWQLLPLSQSHYEALWQS